MYVSKDETEIDIYGLPVSIFLNISLMNNSSLCFQISKTCRNYFRLERLLPVSLVHH